MKKVFFSLAFVLITALGYSQTLQDSLQFDPQKQQNAAQRILSGNISSGVTVGGYGQIDYNQPEGDNGTLDVHRLVMLLGYKFSDKVQFITEIEFEHVKEVFVEQAFLNYSLNDNINIRGGLMLVPMGIVNEYHEPTTFNGVERPNVDSAIVPSTWRELGVGVSGRIDNASLRYQAYIFNGFKSTDDDGTGLLGGSKALRGGRQKGAASTINTPNLSAKLDYYGISGLRLGLSGYFGRTQSPDDLNDVDGSDIGVSMVGFDARYAIKKFTARGQFIHASLTDTEEYNDFTERDLGSSLQGWYLEAAYNVLPKASKQKLFGFVRYEDYNTHASVDGDLVTNDSYHKNEWTTGLSYHVAPGAVVKVDYQILDNAVDNNDSKGKLNFGIGVWF